MKRVWKKTQAEEGKIEQGVTGMSLPRRKARDLEKMDWETEIAGK